MIRTRAQLVDALRNYRSDFKEELEFIPRFLQLLEHPRAYFRDHLPGHLTGSAWIIDPGKQLTLLTHHAKLNKWLQPGGHADGDEDIRATAMREAEEETGLQRLSFFTTSVFDIDIHAIPARGDFPEHDHYDVRFLLTASQDEPLQLTEESHDLAWKKLCELPAITQNNPSILRMAKKVSLLGADQ